jgi:hypothetical protein
MRALSGQQILQICELGAGQRPFDRALTILRVADPERSADEWAALPIGRRDAALIAIWQATFGSWLKGYAECPQCRTPLEFQMAAEEISRAGAAVPVAPSHRLQVSGYELQFRLPDSRDLSAVAECAGPDEARSLWLQRCVLLADRDGAAARVEELPAEVLTKLADYMLECDPQAEVLLTFHCPACAHDWREVLDIATFLWTEITARAKRLLREVQTLARAYAWGEAEILAMSEWRRQRYLEMAGA